jgi:predicted dehydrogenase
VTPETRFVGFDAIQKVVQLPNVDLVILTTPPHFRPEHLRTTITAGKHAFVEKPVAVDPVGVRSVIESADLADQKNLTIVAGTQARRMVHRVELVKRLRDGALGDITGGVCIRMGDASGATWNGRSATGSSTPGSRATLWMKCTSTNWTL